jgi:hypothetical protein
VWWCVLQAVIKQLALNVRDAGAFIDKLNEAGFFFWGGVLPWGL